MFDIFNLQRFVEAQNRGRPDDYASALLELRAGCKRGHWMWYIFPQILGLGASAMSVEYAISSREQAKAYWGDPILGPRLGECTRLVMDIEGKTARQIFSSPDDLKFQSCMPLFDRSVTGIAVFHDALLKYFGGKRDQRTIDILNSQIV